MVEAVRKGYWDPAAETRRALIERWQALARQHGVSADAVTLAFIAQQATGFGLAMASAPAKDARQAAGDTAVPPGAEEPIRGRVLAPAESPSARDQAQWRQWAPIALLLFIAFLGAGAQLRSNARLSLAGDAR
jgi:cobaltochelatase CobN